MKQFAGVALAIALAFGFGATTYADGPGRPEAGPVSPDQIRGEVMKIDGDSITVKDLLSGKDVKFGLEKDMKAKLERPLAVGDKIEAQLTPEGYAKDVRLVASGMDQGTMGKDMNKDMNKSGTTDQTAPKDLGTIQSPGQVAPSGSGMEGGKGTETK